MRPSDLESGVGSQGLGLRFPPLGPQPLASATRPPTLELAGAGTRPQRLTPNPQLPRDYADLTIGVLALQGAFVEHVRAIEALGARAREVRLPADLEGLDGLILPGGESTTIGKLLVEY